MTNNSSRPTRRDFLQGVAAIGTATAASSLFSCSPDRSDKKATLTEYPATLHIPTDVANDKINSIRITPHQIEVMYAQSGKVIYTPQNFVPIDSIHPHNNSTISLRLSAEGKLKRRIPIQIVNDNPSEEINFHITTVSDNSDSNPNALFHFNLLEATANKTFIKHNSKTKAILQLEHEQGKKYVAQIAKWDSKEPCEFDFGSVIATAHPGSSLGTQRGERNSPDENASWLTFTSDEEKRSSRGL